MVYDAWEQLNESLKDALGLSASDCTVRAYQGLAPAIWEITQATAQFYSHKRSVTLVTGNSPHLHPVLPFLYKDGFIVQIVSKIDDAKSFVEGLKKDTNFVIFCEDHAITGETYPVDEIDVLLNEKKITALRISHQNHLYRDIEIRPHTVRICGYNPRSAIAFSGNKYKAPGTMAPLQYWDKETFISNIQTIQKEAQEDESLVKNFEKNLPDGFQVLPMSSSRCFDRSLIYSSTVAGEALQVSLSALMKNNLQKPGWEKMIETTHLCRWGGVGTYQNWWEGRPSDLILRNMLILSTRAIAHPQINQFLQQAQSESQFVIEA